MSYQPPQMTQEQKLARTAFVNKIRLIVDAFMILTGILLFVTSIVKLPFPETWFEKLQNLGIFNLLSYSVLSYVHDIGGLFFLFCLFIHLYLNWKRLSWLIRAAFK